MQEAEGEGEEIGIGERAVLVLYCMYTFQESASNWKMWKSDSFLFCLWVGLAGAVVVRDVKWILATKTVQLNF